MMISKNPRDGSTSSAGGSGGLAPVLQIPQRSFAAVHFPGVVKNPEKAISTLGGEEQVSKAFEKNSKFLELRFRPSDAYSHPIHGDQSLSSDMILQVTRKKSKRTGQTVGAFSAEIVGTVEKCYRFSGMADFQALPPPPKPGLDLGSSESAVATALALEEWTGAGGTQPKDSRSHKNSHADHSNLSSSDNMTQSLLEDLYLPPPIFSRVDHPKDYFYRNNPNFRLEVSENDPNSKRFVGHAKAATFKTIFLAHNDPLPTPPADSPPADMKDTVAKLQILFQDRPMWLQTAIEQHLKAEDLKPHNAKYLIGCLSFVSYLWKSGPFRSAHCRFDFDPRKDASARMYQTIDFRTHDKEGTQAMQMLQTRVPTRKKKMKPKLDIAAISAEANDNNKEPSSTAHEKEKEKESGDKEVEFGKGPKYQFLSVPTRKQTLYQLCDIRDAQIQQFLEKCRINSQCNEKHGWYREEALTKVRLMMKRKLDRFLKKENLSAPLLTEKELIEMDEPSNPAKEKEKSEKEAEKEVDNEKDAEKEKESSATAGDGKKRKRNPTTKRGEPKKASRKAQSSKEASIVQGSDDLVALSSANGSEAATRLPQTLQGSLPANQLAAMKEGIRAAHQNIDEDEDDVEGFALLDEGDEDENENDDEVQEEEEEENALEMDEEDEEEAPKGNNSKNTDQAKKKTVTIAAKKPSHIEEDFDDDDDE